MHELIQQAITSIAILLGIAIVLGILVVGANYGNQTNAELTKARYEAVKTCYQEHGIACPPLERNY